MIGYAVKPDSSWRCVDTETMSLDTDETFQFEQPPISEPQEATE